MTYAQSLPRIGDLRQLAKEVISFPINGLGIVQYAEHLGYDDHTIDFLKLFSKYRTFNSRTDFLRHCSLLERLLKEEHRSVPEHTRSPQD